MSISTQTGRTDYTGNGSTASYGYTFLIFDDDHIQLIARDPDNGDEYVLEKSTHYSVSGVQNPSGGTITLVDGAFPWIDTNGYLEDAWALAMIRSVPITQETDIRNQGAYLPEMHEDALDYRTMVDQRQQEEIDRSIKLPRSIAATSYSATLDTGVLTAGSYLVVNETANGFTTVTAGGEGGGGGVNIVSLAARIFNTGTYSVLKALSAATPTLQRFAFITDRKQFGFYCADQNEGDDGWFLCPISFVGE